VLGLRWGRADWLFGLGPPNRELRSSVACSGWPGRDVGAVGGVLGMGEEMENLLEIRFPYFEEEMGVTATKACRCSG
jgi:hypothetical protein